MPAKKEDNEQGTLRKQLTALAKQLDTEGLLFLIEQANSIKYNMEAEKANAAVASVHKEGKEQSGKNDHDAFSIEAEADKSSFIFVLRGNRKFFTREEMRELIAVTGTHDSEALYRYLQKERRDFLTDCSIRSAKDPILEVISATLQNKYKLKR